MAPKPANAYTAKLKPKLCNNCKVAKPVWSSNIPHSASYVRMYYIV